MALTAFLFSGRAGLYSLSRAGGDVTLAPAQSAVPGFSWSVAAAPLEMETTALWGLIGARAEASPDVRRVLDPKGDVVSSG